MKLPAQLVAFAALAFAADRGLAESSRPGAIPGWTWPPQIIVSLAVVGAWYAIGVIRMSRYAKRCRPQLRPALWFALGWLSLLIALDSPIHELSEQLFWVHMTQHEMLMLISAPLLALGKPLPVFLWALPAVWRRPVAATARWKPFHFTWSRVTSPVSAWLIFAAALWVWHAPSLFSATLSHEWIHAAQHLSFLLASLLFWWPLVAHGAERNMRSLGYGAALIYVFTTGLHMTLLGVLITLAPTVWYTPYLATAPAWHLTALQDQQIGGLIMWIPAGVELLIVALVLMAKWLRESDRRWEYTRTAALLRGQPVSAPGSGGRR